MNSSALLRSLALFLSTCCMVLGLASAKPIEVIVYSKTSYYISNRTNSF